MPILPDFSGEELDMIIEHSEARALLVSDKLFTKLSKETIGRLNVVIRTKNLGVIAQQVRRRDERLWPHSAPEACVAGDFPEIQITEFYEPSAGNAELSF